jgi:hypothetical protein
MVWFVEQASKAGTESNILCSGVFVICVCYSYCVYSGEMLILMMVWSRVFTPFPFCKMAGLMTQADAAAVNE